MNRVRKRFVTKPLALVLPVVFLLTNAGGVMFTSALFSALASIALLLANASHATAASLQHAWGNLTVAALFAPPGGAGTNAIGIGEDLPTSPSTGTPPRWQGNVAGTNTKLGNKLMTEVCCFAHGERGEYPIRARW